MRIALYDFATLRALTTIEFPDAELASPKPWQCEIKVNADLVLAINLQAVLIWMPLDGKGPSRTYAAIAAGAKSAEMCRLPFFPEKTTLDEIPPQLRPQAGRMIRDALKMGDAR